MQVGSEAPTGMPPKRSARRPTRTQRQPFVEGLLAHKTDLLASYERVTRHQHEQLLAYAHRYARAERALHLASDRHDLKCEGTPGMPKSISPLCVSDTRLRQPMDKLKSHDEAQRNRHLALVIFLW